MLSHCWPIFACGITFFSAVCLSHLLISVVWIVQNCNIFRKRFGGPDWQIERDRPGEGGLSGKGELFYESQIFKEMRAPLVFRFNNLCISVLLFLPIFAGWALFIRAAQILQHSDSELPIIHCIFNASCACFYALRAVAVQIFLYIFLNCKLSVYIMQVAHIFAQLYCELR